MTNKVMQNKTQKQIAVIGGGLSGVCTAYFLALAGFEVAVLERRGNVAEEASFGNSGLLAPGVAQPLVLPGLLGMAGGGRFKRNRRFCSSPHSRHPAHAGCASRARNSCMPSLKTNHA